MARELDEEEVGPDETPADEATISGKEEAHPRPADSKHPNKRSTDDQSVDPAAKWSDVAESMPQTSLVQCQVDQVEAGAESKSSAKSRIQQSLAESPSSRVTILVTTADGVQLQFAADGDHDTLTCLTYRHICFGSTRRLSASERLQLHPFRNIRHATKGQSPNFRLGQTCRLCLNSSTRGPVQVRSRDFFFFFFEKVH